MILYSLPILAASLILIMLISDRLIRYVLVLSRAVGLSEMAAGFVLLSIITSLPELSMSTVASLAGEGDLSVGNVLGSNIANLTIILGLAILFSRKNIKIGGQSQKELVQFLFLTSIIPLFIVQQGTLGPVLGIILLIMFIYFGVTVSRKTQTTPKEEPLQQKNENLAFVVVKFLIGIGLVIFLSDFAVESSIDIAGFIGLPTSIIGATIIGLGTSLPELATTIQALKQGLYNMALGNLLGSCITNITLILGVTSLLSVSEVNVVAVQSIMFYVLISSLSVWYMISSNERITKKSAIFLCLIYVVFILQQIGVSVVIF
ncbi:MAG: sodium:calcium antiporter [Candidatus Bathyarchaeota archaeon]|nr:sodium:calcium antiporter [Candidatus Bathyarchaeum tardum]WGM88897.1 MAG: sodium:calcium antiporter [Candidatus Bathyarchaeum tardum]WNZ28863.1 MAG: sodium:calcium antiporter [Candidatus Bathyarchaeota archaeon]